MSRNLISNPISREGFAVQCKVKMSEAKNFLSVGNIRRINAYMHHQASMAKQYLWTHCDVSNAFCHEAGI